MLGHHTSNAFFSVQRILFRPKVLNIQLNVKVELTPFENRLGDTKLKMRLKIFKVFYRH